MERLNYSISINAPRERVWKILWNDDTYPRWTEPFGPGGRAVTDWKEGGRIHFLAASDDGMYSSIERKEENAYMAFKHLGTVKNGVEQSADASQAWVGSEEAYTLTERNGGTELAVVVDVEQEEVAKFNDAFPQAFAIVKALAEQ